MCTRDYFTMLRSALATGSLGNLYQNRGFLRHSVGLFELLNCPPSSVVDVLAVEVGSVSSRRFARQTSFDLDAAAADVLDD
jgi:hypothetical protein